MIALLLRAALHQRFVTLLVAVLVVALGIYSLEQLKVEAYPDISDTQVVVITLLPGHAAEEMEQEVTVPVERALNSVPNVIARRSRTIFGLSVVELTFAYGTDDYFARQVVLEKLREASLPDGAETSLGPLSTPIGELFRYTLRGPASMGERQLREIQDWVITPRLLQVPGVADVAPFGGLVKQYQVDIDPTALEKYDLTVAAIAHAIGANNRNGGGAMLDNRQQALAVRGVGLLRTTADLEQVVLTSVRGVPVLVRDVGTVHLGAALQTGILGVNDQPGGVEGIVLMRRGENPSEVLAGVSATVEALNRTGFPPGVQIVPIYDRRDLVSNTLRTVSRTLIEGLLIVLAVLFVFLGSVRGALLAAVTIPFSLLFAFICMYWAGIPANLLSLGALDFGIIVDGTLVMVEYIVASLSRPAREGDSIVERVRDAALQVQRPIFFSLVILISAYLPLFTLERVERRLFTPMAFTVCAALLGSLLFTLTVIPVLSTYLFKHQAHASHGERLDWLYRPYRRLLARTMPRAGLVVGAAAVIVLVTMALARGLGSEFLPQLDEGVIWIRANLPPGVSLSKSAEIATQMRALIRQSPEVKTVASQTGRNDSGTDPFGPNRNELLLTLQPYDEWGRGRNKAVLVDELSTRLRREIPGITLNFTQPIIDTVTESVTGSSADLAVILSGPDLNELRDLAARSLAVVRQVPGAVDTAIEQEADQPQLRIGVDRQQLARYGVNVDDIQELIELGLGGRTVSTLFEGERRFDIVVRYAAEARTDIDDLSRLLVHTADGGRIPLGTLAEIKVANGASIIARRENQRQMTVRTNIRGRDQGGFVTDARRRFEDAIALPDGYKVEWGGQFENLDRARRRLTVIMPVTVGLIFALLFLAFDSTTYAFLVLMNVPLSLVGGIIALWLRGINLSVSAAVGFISLFGVAVMSGVLVVAEITRRRQVGEETLEEDIVEGAIATTRPVLMMIVAALLGMIPAARAIGIGSDVQRPLATVVVGGLASTLLLTLIVLPNLYYLVYRRRRSE
ncbi:CusA/CzcA family heavy metal efflux RND transporter [Luteitalea sp.]|uniref:efflux RND transporter permease subunit n=1 Tax=Luteitalea sp. TaxID=2004800 RepID=UPI0025BF9578|nr:CusA/CzcA family heavy metal efflux RND transporter [Luteitalea sp.]